jgi:hypothetical protein
MSPRSARLGERKVHSAGIWRAVSAGALACSVLLCLAASAAAEPPPATTKLVYAAGKIVPIPASIPHEEGDMVDRRIVPDLLWIAQRYPIYITDGYSGPLPSGEHVGCNNCHVRDSDHYNGLAVDIVPQEPSAVCDARWKAITRLALWAEPQQNQPVPPFRWVGYEGDAGHGCGNHLHLSWNHAPAGRYELAEWVEVFPAGAGTSRKPPGLKPVPAPKPTPKPQAPPKPKSPPGGYSPPSTGGLSPTGEGD